MEYLEIYLRIWLIRFILQLLNSMLEFDKWVSEIKAKKEARKDIIIWLIWPIPSIILYLYRLFKN